MSGHFLFLKCFLPVFFSAVLFCSSEAQPVPCEKPSKLINTFQQFHYRPLQLNDHLSERIYENFFLLIDPEADYFSKSDIAVFDEYRTKLDDMINSNSCEFIDRVSNFYRKRLADYAHWLDQQELGDISFDTDEFIEFTNERVVSQNPEELMELWRKSVKFSYMVKMHFVKLEGEATKPEKEVWTEVIERERCRLNKILEHPEGFDLRIFSLFLKAISQSFDPHSVYLSEYEKQEFDALLSMESNGYGINISRNMLGEIEIKQLVPGSPAWNSDEIDKGDIIVGLNAAGSSVDLECMDEEELQPLFQTSRYSTLHIKIRKKSGSLKTVTLHSGEIIVEGNSLKTFVIHEDKKLGYISIPSFYTSYEDEFSVKGVADDLAKEILMLKREGVKGIILDLRSNGGGSLDEAIKMVGMFINEGPVLTIETAAGVQKTIKDYDRGKLYSGPLLVMINGLSASASELFAACMQDYGRAVIVGTTSFGKSTAQLVLPAFSDQPIGEITEYANITLEGFYRVSGKSHQKTGVVPDIEFPDAYQSFYEREQDYPDALTLEETDPNMVFNREKLPLSELKKLSDERITANESFEAVRQLNNELKAEGVNLKISLNEAGFGESFKKISLFISKLESVHELKNDSLAIEIPEHVQYDASYDEVKEQDYLLKEQSAEKDLFLSEACRILSDQISILKNGK